MGKPRLIILIRHAQSEGNKNKEIHQIVPDHRVKLTDEGHQQAEEAGRRLRSLLRPDDTLQIYTSPYRRTRETTEGILRTLTARDDPDDPSAAPSPFSREKIKVYEEPRIREQDFGNFQPCSAEMERMWQERADYGHFFYRIANGESAADAYDRISGFNESLWRQFGEADFPSVCVLVTHGLMTRVFLMKWYHWSVEYFEDLRNINHCEFIQMKKDPESAKYILQNDLRTWSELRRQKRIQEAKENPRRKNTLSSFLSGSQGSPAIPPRKWGGCAEGCDHDHDSYPRRHRQNNSQSQPELKLPSPAQSQPTSDEKASHPDTDSGVATEPNEVSLVERSSTQLLMRPPVARYLRTGRDGGGTASGANTPHELSDEENTEYFDSASAHGPRSAIGKAPSRTATSDDIQRWAHESGMGNGTKADALGDEPNEYEAETESSTGEEDLAKAEEDDKGLRGSVY
ncbi:uncharacterized protein RCC_03903 [Ramularia collo-cygni]|uniref:Phosphoglycerate mutase family domain protein n=1 Tax=Ramularia collo-cygni TaxID=112498 RepID=A0A2D3UV79_9PEZI|nr:uncharacterized protein RCC_03903 [Ramularia collo-cygni]CZT18065.1 uncharacterized protein RCC_03903 [Ramularia collo-cygni]